MFSKVLFIISSLVFLASAQCTIPVETYHLSYTVKENKAVDYFVNEITWNEYKLIDRKRLNEDIPYEVDYPYTANKSIRWSPTMKRCQVNNQKFEDLRVVPRINTCIEKGEFNKTTNTYSCKGGSVKFRKDLISGYNFPIEFEGLILQPGQKALIQKTEYFFKKSFERIFSFFPKNLRCEGLDKEEINLVQSNYNILKLNNHSIEENLKVLIDNTGLHLKAILMHRNNEKKIFIPELSLEWKIDQKGCQKELIPILNKDDQISSLYESIEIMWQRYTLPKFSLSKSLKMPLFLGEKMFPVVRYESLKPANLTIFGENFKNSSINLYYNTQDNHIAKITIYDEHSEVDYIIDKKNLDKRIIAATITSEKHICRKVSKSKRFTLLGSVSKRDLYSLDDMANVYKNIAYSMILDDKYFSVLRLSDITASIIDQQLSLSFVVDEPEPEKDYFHLFEGQKLKNKPYYKFETGDVDACSRHCYEDSLCSGFEIVEKKNCQLFNETTLIKSAGAKSSYIYLPVFKESSIAESFEYAKSKTIEISLNGDIIQMKKFFESMQSEMISASDEILETFKPIEIDCSSFIILDQVKNIVQCARRINYFKNQQILGFVYDLNNSECKLCFQRNSDIRRIPNSEDKKLSFKVDFLRGFTNIFTKNIKKKLQESTLLHFKVHDENNCAQICEKSTENFCLGYFYCSGECYLSGNYEMDIYKTETTEKTDECSAMRKNEERLFSEFAIKIQKKNLPKLQKVKSEEASGLVVDRKKNVGYLVCNDDLTDAYIVSESTVDAIYESSKNPDTICRYKQQKALSSFCKVVEKDIIHKILKGHSKGAITGIVISMFLLALVVTVAGMYFWQKRTNDFGGQHLSYSKT